MEKDFSQVMDEAAVMLAKQKQTIQETQELLNEPVNTEIIDKLIMKTKVLSELYKKEQENK